MISPKPQFPDLAAIFEAVLRYAAGVAVFEFVWLWSRYATTAEVQLVIRTQTVLAFFFALLQKNFNTDGYEKVLASGV